MMRYKPKIPVYGGTMAEKKKQEFCNDNENNTDNNNEKTTGTTTPTPAVVAAGSRSVTGKRIDYKTKQMLEGGPVQRAIKADLISLQDLFFQELEKRRRQRRLEGEKQKQQQQRGHQLFGNHGTKPKALLEDVHIDKAEIILEEHETNGSTFQLFKKVFQESKIGIIFTRAAPYRIDNESFVQLIYSAALSFLKDANVQQIDKNRTSAARTDDGDSSQSSDSNSESQSNDHTSEMDESSNFYFHASFAIYALYTLYKTNPAPHIPMDTSTSVAAQNNDDEQQVNDNQYHQNRSTSINTKGSTSVNNTTPHFTPTEFEILSTLPMFETESRKYRRHYHAPIRISYELMQFVLQIRNQSLMEIDSCHQSQYNSLMMIHRHRYQQRQHRCAESKEKEGGGEEKGNDDDDDDDEKINDYIYNESKIRATSKIFMCKCGLAKDCITLIDRLISDQCFHYCEYDGPVSVESLAGSDAYVKKMIFEQDEEENGVVIINDDDKQDDCDNNQILEELEEINDQCHSLTEFLKLDDMQESFQQYHDCLGKASMSLRKQGMGLQSSTSKPKRAMGAAAVGNKHQIASIQKTMEPVMKQRLRRKSIHFPRKIQNMFLTNNVDGDKDDETDDDNNINDTEAILQDATDEEHQVKITHGPSDSIENQNNQTKRQGQDQELLSTTKTGIRFTYPASFSKSLKESIGKALEEIDFLESQTELDRDKDKEDSKTEYGVFHNNGNEIARDNDNDNEIDIEHALFDETSVSNDNELIDNDNSDDNSDDIDIDSVDTSHIVGSGNAALQLLLKRANNVITQSSEKVEKKRQQLKRKRKSSSIITQKKKASNRKNSYYSDDVSVSVQSRSSVGTGVMLGDNESVAVCESGKVALKELLQKASKGRAKQTAKKKKTSTKNHSKQRRRAVASNSSSNDIEYGDQNSTEADGKEDDVSIFSGVSTATGILESGKGALQDLLRIASQGKPVKKPIHKQSMDVNAEDIESRKGRLNDDESYFSRTSTTTTGIQGSGREALQDLLQKTLHGKSSKESINQDSIGADTNSDVDTGVGLNEGKIERRGNHLNDDVSVYSKMSTLTTDIQGSGKEALQELLRKVTGDKKDEVE